VIGVSQLVVEVLDSLLENLGRDVRKGDLSMLLLGEVACAAGPKGACRRVRQALVAASALLRARRLGKRAGGERVPKGMRPGLLRAVSLLGRSAWT